MARMSCVVVPDVPQHVTQHGNRRMKTFFCPEDYEAYIDYLCVSTRQAGTQVWAYCLMPNHVHLILAPSDKDGLRATFAEAHRQYTRRIHTEKSGEGICSAFLPHLFSQLHPGGESFMNNAD